MSQYEDSKTENKEGLIIVTNKIIDNIRRNRTTITRKLKWAEKQLYGYFKQQSDEISQERTWTWLRKGTLKRETESILRAAGNYAIRTNYIQAKIDNR